MAKAAKYYLLFLSQGRAEITEADLDMAFLKPCAFISARIF
jgi:hypothetical protein